MEKTHCERNRAIVKRMLEKMAKYRLYDSEESPDIIYCQRRRPKIGIPACSKCGYIGHLHQKGRDFPDFMVGVIQCPSCCFILDLFFDRK